MQGTTVNLNSMTPRFGNLQSAVPCAITKGDGQVTQTRALVPATRPAELQ